VRNKQAIDEVFGSGGNVFPGAGELSRPVVFSIRIRLARNLAGRSFPGWADEAARAQVLDESFSALEEVKDLSGAAFLKMEELGEFEKLALVESHLISRELMASKQGSGVVVKKTLGCAIMVNEEDHLRIQMVRRDLDLADLLRGIDAIDNAIEEKLDYAFSDRIGYLTACPTNLGTAMRASAMMHLPGLCLAGHMEQVIRTVAQLGLAVRGHFGEGTEATGSIFQISNQQTLGEDEGTIIKRLGNVLSSVIEQELNAREKLLEEKGDKFLDKIGRARGVLQNGHLLSSEEGMDILSLTRLAADMEMIPAFWRDAADRLLVETQPGHMQVRSGGAIDPATRDALRAKIMREEFAQLPTLTHINGAMSANS
jgi:protein arginine kinase